VSRIAFRVALLGATLAALVAVGGAAGRPDGGAAAAVSPSLVISQVYGAGGNNGAAYQNDFVELFNRGAAPASVTGMSLQYTSASGTGSFTASALPDRTIPPGGYLLIAESGGANGTPLPAPDGSGTLSMAAGSGKIALATGTTGLGCNGGSTPCDATAAARIVDLVGYGSATFYEGAGPAPGIGTTTSDFRAGNGCVDTDDNAADFAAAAVAPRNSATAAAPCGGGGTDTAPSVAATSPADGATEVAETTSPTVTFSEPVAVDAGAFTIACATSGAHALSVSGGPTTYTLDPAADFASGESCTLTVHAASVHDLDGTPDSPAADTTLSFATAAPVTPTAIHELQGASHVSPFAGQTVTTTGVVTARSGNGFWLQDPSPDADPATSEGIFVFTSSTPAAAVGDAVRVRGRVQEFRPGGASNGNLTTTELSGSPTVTVLSSGNPLPAATLVGPGGRIPPGETIEDDAAGGDVENGSTFDPASDGLDFWESMEGMRVEIDDAVAVGPTATSFGETPIVSNGAAGVRTPRGGVIARPTDFNPERVIVDDLLAPAPTMNVGDRYTSPVVGVLDYNFGNFFLEVTQTPSAVHDGVTPESTTPQGADELAVATFNVENLDPGDGAAKFDRLAHIVVDNLRSPDLIGAEEVQDDGGATDSGTVDATVTLDTLVAAIEAAGGPHYAYRLVDPENDQDGGEPGGNIRVAFLFRTDRGLSFVDAPGATATTPNAVTASGDLQYSPGRIDPTNAAWTDSRKPLAGEFVFRGRKLFVIANHFNSKGGDDPLMGHRQPPQFPSEVQRHQQATVVRDFVRELLDANPDGDVVVLGDLNDFQFSETLSILKTAPLHDLIETLPANEQYSYDFEGNSETLDHVLVSDALFARPIEHDVVHVNAEFADQASDHDPQVSRIAFPTAYQAVCARAREASSSRALAGSICVALDVAEKQAAAGHRVAARAALTAAEVLVRVGGRLGAFSSAEVAELLAAIRAL
jgi:predicted extracellular nuclease